MKKTIDIVNNEILVTFERNTKLRGYYTEIFINSNSIIIENEFTKYDPKRLLIKERLLKYLMVK